MATSPGPSETPVTVKGPFERGRSRPGTPNMEVRGQLITPCSYSSTDSPFGDMSPKLKAERIRDLMERQRSLQEALSLKLKELKRICLQEAELTGQVPAEYPLEVGERPPHIRRRVGAVYRMPNMLALKGEDQLLEELDREFTMQQQIVEAARKLVVAADLNVEQRRKRKQVYADALKRLQDLEEQGNEHRARLGKKPMQRVSQILQEDSLHSESSSLSESASHENDESQGFSGSKPHLLPDRPSPPRGRDHMRAMSSSPDRRPGWKISPAEIYCELKNRRNSVASPTSPTRTFPRSISSFEGRSVPATPVLARSALSGNHLRPDGVGMQNRQWSGSQDSQMGFPSDRAGLYAARSRRSNSSEALIERAPGEPSDANEPLYAVIKPPFKSAETLASDRSFSSQSVAYPSPDPHQHLHYQYERPNAGRGLRTGNHQPTNPGKQLYGDILVDYYLGKQQTRVWTEPDGRVWAEPNGRVWVEPDGRVWAETDARGWPESDGIGHFSRRDGHAANHQDFASPHPGHPHAYTYMDSPGLRSRAEAQRAKVTRTKSCGPHVPIEPEAQFQKHWQHEAPTPQAHHTPRSRSQQRCPGPDPADRRMHKALALEGLRDWYIRNAAGHRPPLDRRPPPPQHHQRYYDAGQQDQYYSSSPMSHSMSFNGPPLASRHYTEFLYEEELNHPLNGLVMLDGGFSLERDVNSPGTLV